MDREASDLNSAFRVTKPDLNRRQIITAAGVTVLAAVAASDRTAAAEVPPEKLGENNVEGYFFLFSDRNEEDRVFFISSEWMEYFEVPLAFIKGGDRAKFVKKIRKAGGAQHRKANVKALYSNLGDLGVHANPNVVPPSPPG